MNREIETKTERVARFLDREKLGGVLLNAQYNFAWITGGSSNGIDLSRENGSASVFLRKDGKRFVLASNIEMPRMLAEAVSIEDFEPVEFSWQDEKASSELIVSNARRLTDGQVVSDIQIHACPRAVENMIAPLRYSLAESEIERYRKLGQDAADAIATTIEAIKPGNTEFEIEAVMRQELAAKRINSVVTLVAADERIAKYRHPIPTANRWQKLVLLVTCAKRDGLIASLSRMVCVGEIPAELQEKTQAAAFVNASLYSATDPGISGAELYRIAADAYAACGFADEINNHHQGGAAGYKTRDWVAHPKSTEVVKENQAFAWNPSIIGTKVEETMIVTGDGIATITRSPDFPTITSTIDGREFHSPGILTI